MWLERFMPITKPFGTVLTMRYSLLHISLFLVMVSLLGLPHTLYAQTDDFDLLLEQEVLRLEVGDDILFASGRAELTPERIELIAELTDLLRDERLTIVVEGHTDNVPINTEQFPSNWELSTARAEAVAAELSRRGIANERLRVIGYADTRPRSPNDTAANRARNRRVTLVLELADPADAAQGTLKRTYLQALEQTDPPVTAPLQQNRFVIDEDIKEFTVLAFRPPQQTITILDPDGANLIQDYPDDQVRHRIEQGYELITVDTPRTGEWVIDGPLDPDNRVMVITDLGLNVDSVPGIVRHTDPVPITVWVTEQNQRSQRVELLSLIEATVTLTPLRRQAADPSQQVTVLELDEQTMSFQGQVDIRTLPIGSYQLRVDLDGGTFQRQMNRRLRIASVPLSFTYTTAAPTTAGRPATLTATLRVDPERIDSHSVSGWLRITDPRQHTQVIELSDRVGTVQEWEIPLTVAGDYRLNAEINARDPQGTSLTIQPDTETLTVAFTDPPMGDGSNDFTLDLSWQEILLIVAVVNISFMLLLGLIWLLFRPKKSKV